MTVKIKQKILLIALAVFWGGYVSLTQAAYLSVTPIVIDEKAMARDILKASVTLTSSAPNKLNVYVVVNNIAVEKGRQEFLDPSRADHSASLANWIEISRGVIDLMPGEKKKIDFKIRVNLTAKPGLYHAIIAFAEGSTREEAESKIPQAAAVIVNLEVMEDLKEKLQLNKFVPDKIFFPGFPVSFSYELENIGNRTVTPAGEIRIYNRLGEEVSAINANQDNASLDPNAKKQLASIWQSGRGFGRYKALISLEYGAKQRGTLYDTVYFWVIPWPKILMIFGVLSLIVISIIYFWHRRYEQQKKKLTELREKNTFRPKVIDLEPPPDRKKVK